MSDDVTLGEVSRRLAALEHQFTAGVDRLGNRIDALQFVHRDVHRADVAAVRAELAVERARTDELEEDKKWMRRALLTGLLLPIVLSLLLATLMLVRV